METRLYRIVDWENLYENNRTRNMKNMLWVPVPVKHDGYGYCQLVQELGAAGLGAWLAILQTAAKSHPRGTLMRDACNPHDAKSISIISRLDAKIIHKTIELCATPDIGWLEVVEIQGDMIQPAEIPHPPAEIPHPPARKGREWKGRETIETYGFNEVWASYPDKSDKQKALEEWIKHAKNGVTPEIAIAGIERYKAYIANKRKSGFNQQYKNGATFFRNAGWESEYKTEVIEKPRNHI